VAANIIDGDAGRISQIQNFFKPVHTTGTAKCCPGTTIRGGFCERFHRTCHQLGTSHRARCPILNRRRRAPFGTIRCEVRGSKHQACIPRRAEILPMPDPRGRFLRVVCGGGEGNQTAILFRGQRRRAIRVCRTTGSLERPERAVGKDMLDPDHDANCSDLNHP
jgi:hypothetical protein